MPSDSPRINFTGIWQLNLEKSFIHGPTPGHVVMKIEHREPSLKQEVVSRDSDGQERRRALACEIGTESVNIIMGATARTYARWERPELVIETWMKIANRELHFKDHWSMSADGKILTMIHRDDDLAGQTSVLTRIN
jgi:hypothetical protein